MFGLIPMVITILLAAVVAAAFSFFGGAIFGDSSEEAQALRIVNEGEQIASAIKMFRFHEFKSPTDLAGEILNNTKYYKGGSDTASGTWSAAPSSLAGVAATVENENVCKVVNEKLGFTDPVPTCDAVPPALSDTSRFYCCSAP